RTTGGTLHRTSSAPTSRCDGGQGAPEAPQPGAARVVGRPYGRVAGLSRLGRRRHGPADVVALPRPRPGPRTERAGPPARVTGRRRGGHPRKRGGRAGRGTPDRGDPAQPAAGVAGLVVGAR